MKKRRKKTLLEQFKHEIGKDVRDLKSVFVRPESKPRRTFPPVKVKKTPVLIDIGKTVIESVRDEIDEIDVRPKIRTVPPPLPVVRDDYQSDYLSNKQYLNIPRDGGNQPLVIVINNNIPIHNNNPVNVRNHNENINHNKNSSCSEGCLIIFAILFGIFIAIPGCVHSMTH
jgi:hypothetical protein